ncbi:hypothetical protein [Streptomyces sp. NPDC048200]|uniref:hypothetical protein n=1 Tax=Streptomyces sp. NPDC048200 TaxID=3365512 RepID=UPI00371C917F
MTETTPAERRERYAAPLYALMRQNGWDGERTEPVVREMGLVLDAVIAVADAEQAEMRERHKAGLRRADRINNELMEEVQRYAEGKERPVLWSVYNAMHRRAADAETALETLRRGTAATVPASAPTDQVACDCVAEVHVGVGFYHGPTCATKRSTTAPTDRAALSARLWAVAEHNIVAEWICCEPINPDHELCVQGDATRRMVKALLVDDPEAIRPAPLLDTVVAVLPACPDPIECSHEAALGQAEAATEAYRLALSQALGLGTGANWEALRDRGRDLVAEVAELTRAVRRLGGREQAPADRAESLLLHFAAEAHRRKWAYDRGISDNGVPVKSEAFDALHRLGDEMRTALDKLRRLADAASGPGRADGETQQDETQARRGDVVEAWLKAQRDAAADHPEAYQAADGLLDLYRLHADTGTPLGEHVCEGRTVGDCDCLEQPAAVSQPGKDETPSCEHSPNHCWGCPGGCASCRCHDEGRAADRA